MLACSILDDHVRHEALPMSDSKTYFAPVDPTHAPFSIEDLILRLQAAGFLGEAIHGWPRSFRFPNEDVQRFIANALVEPSAIDDSFISFEFAPEMELFASCYFDEADVACRCGFRLGDNAAPLFVRAWESKATRDTVQCPSCRRENYPWEWNWHHCVGFGRQWIEAGSGNPVPTQELLALLKECTGLEWDYTFYHL